MSTQSFEHVLATVEALRDPTTGQVPKEKIAQLVADLPAEQLLKVTKIVQEQARRIREEGARYYKPLPKQLEVHCSTAQTRIAHGGNRSGKTELGAKEVNWWATGTHPYRDTPTPPLRIRVCGVSWPHIGRVTLRKFKETCLRSELRGGSWDSAFTKNLADMEEPATLTWANGSVAQFMTYEQRVKKYSGDDIDFCWEDEEPPEGIHRENEARLLDRNGSMLITLTPDDGITWLYEALVVPGLQGDPDIRVFQLLTEENRHLSMEALDRLKRQWSSDPELLQIKTRGEFVNLGGQVIRGLREDVHVVDDFDIDGEFPYWPRCVAIDPAPSKSHAALWLAMDTRRESLFEGKFPIYVYRELIFDGGKRVRDFCDEVKRRCLGPYIHFWPFDPHWNWVNAAADNFNVFEEFGKYLPVYEGQENKDEVYYESIKDRLGFDRLASFDGRRPKSGLYFFREGAAQTVGQVKRLARIRPKDAQKASTDKMPVRKVNDDLVDCLGLALTDAFVYSEGIEAGGSESMKQPEYQYDPVTGRVIG